MSSCIKLFGLSNRIFNRLFYFKGICSSQLLNTSNYNANFYSTNAAISKGNFTKLSDDLINERPPISTIIKERRGQDERRGVEMGMGADQIVLEGLRNLEHQVRRSARLDLFQVQKVIDSIQDELSSVESSMLLRCCGSFLVSIPPKERQKLTNQVWNIIQRKGKNLNTQVYNTLLLTKLENGEEFSPLKVLDELENVRKITPSKITYELLFAGFCEQGDISGASKIMEHMKSLDFPLNHFVFHYLIRAHIKNNDIDGAKNIIKTMKGHGLEATQDTYKMYLLSLAEIGNMNTIRDGLSDMQSEKLRLNNKSIYDIAIASSKHQHLDNSKEILKLLRFCSDNDLIHNDSLNSALQLVAIGDVMNAVEVLKDMALDEEMKSKLCGRCIRKCLDNYMPVDKIFELHGLMVQGGLINVTHSLLFHWSAVNSSQLQELPHYKYKYELQMIDYLRSKGEDIRISHFLPLLNHSFSSKNLQQVYAVTKATYINSMKVNEPILSFLMHRLLPVLTQQFNQSVDDVIKQLKKLGISSAVLDCLCVGHHIKRGEFESAIQLLSKDDTSFSRHMLNKQIAEAFFIDKPIQQLVKLVSAIDGKLDSGRSVEFNSMLLMNLMSQNQIDLETITDVIDAFKQANITISEKFVKKLENELTKLNAPTELLQRVSSLTRREYANNINQTLFKLSTEELENMLKLNNKSHSIKKTLLLKYATEGDIVKAEEMNNSLTEQQFIFPPQLLRQLGFMYARYKQDKQTALYYLQLIKTQHPGMLRYSNLLLEICILELLDGRYTEAVELLHMHSEKIKGKLIEDGISDSLFMHDSCLRLLKASSGINPYIEKTAKTLHDSSLSKKVQNDPWKTYDLMEMLFDYGFIRRGSYSLLNYTTELFIQNGDVDDLLACYERIVLRFKDAPCPVGVLSIIASSNDENKFDKAIELTGKVLEESVVKKILFFVYISLKKGEEAAKILKEVNLKFEEKSEEILKLVKHNKEDDLLLLEQVSQGSFLHMQAIFQLIRLYAKINDGDKVQWAYSLFGKNGLRPKPSMQTYIASVYSTLGIPLPKQLEEHLASKNHIDANSLNDISSKLYINESKQQAIESKTSEKSKKRISGKGKKEKILNDAVEEKSETPVVKASQKVHEVGSSKSVRRDRDQTPPLVEKESQSTSNQIAESESTLVSGDEDVRTEKPGISVLVSDILKLDGEGKKKEAAHLLSYSARQLNNNRDYKGLRTLIYEMSGSKQLYLVDELRKLKLNNKFAERFFNKRLFLTYIHNEKSSEILDYLDSNNDKVQNFVSLDVLTELHNQQPITFNRLEELIVKGGDIQSNFALIHLHNFYINQQMTQKAEALLQENSLLKKRLEIRQNRLSKQQQQNDESSQQQFDGQTQQQFDQTHQ